jgi:hypothetical protein
MAESNLSHTARSHCGARGIMQLMPTTFGEIQSKNPELKSIDDPEWYWDAVVRDLGWTFTRPYARVLDASRGIAWPQWFPGGETNLTANCCDRNIAAVEAASPR